MKSEIAKKIAAAVLVAAVVCTAVGILAASGEGPPADAVAQVTHSDGTVEYCTNAASFVEFIESPSTEHPKQEPGDVFTLLANISVNRSVCVGFQPNDGTHYQGTAIQNVTLDGSGHKLTADKKGTWNVKAFHELVKVMGTNCTLKNISLDSTNKAWGVGAGDCQHTRADGNDEGGRITKTKTKGLTLEDVHSTNTTGGNYALKLFKTEVYASNVSFTESKNSEPTISLDDAQCKLFLRGSKIQLEPKDPSNNHNHVGGKVAVDTLVTAKNYDMTSDTYNPPFGSNTFYYLNLDSTVKREYIVYRENKSTIVPYWRTEFEELVGNGDRHGETVEMTIKALGANGGPNFAAPEGHVFKEWNTEPDGTGDPYAPGDTVFGNHDKSADDKWDDDLILYAIWEKISIPVHFMPNAMDAGSMDDQTYKGTALTLRGNTFTCAGWDFARWNTHPNGGGTDYENEQTIQSLDASLTLYAQWEPRSCTVTFDANDGTGTMEPQIVPFRAIAKLNNCGFTHPAGEDFAGWGTAADGTGEIYAQGAAIQFTDPDETELTLYALWVPAA